MPCHFSIFCIKRVYIANLESCADGLVSINYSMDVCFTVSVYILHIQYSELFALSKYVYEITL